MSEGMHFLRVFLEGLSKNNLSENRYYFGGEN